MAEYQLTATDTVFKREGEWWIPNDPGNAMRIEYDKWLADGGVPDPYVPPPEVPPTPPPEATLLYDHENRLRTLEGQPPLTMQDLLTKLIQKTPTPPT